MRSLIPLAAAVAASLAANELPRRFGLAEFRGRLLPYEIVGGRAVHGGDMVLGRAEEFGAGQTRKVKAGPGGLVPRAAAVVEDDFLWPGGVVPYEIAPELTPAQREGIPEAIAEWNSRTVVSLVPRDGQADYVLFAPDSAALCAADLGRQGGMQKIYVTDWGCGKDAIVHEIGHVLGLGHEHQREDRDSYLMVGGGPGGGRTWHTQQFTAEFPPLGPYNYRSAMHYPLPIGEHGSMETIPPGLDVPAAGLSPGDIDGVARLYGRPPTATTISTNPPGLELVVDGERITAPATFDWPEGGSHRIEAPPVQFGDGVRFLFGRWNVGGGRSLDVTAGEATWLEANYVVQNEVWVGAEWPIGAGSVALSPPSPSGYYTIRQRVTAHATPARGYQFWSWLATTLHSGGANPATIQLPWREPWEFAAYFAEGPLFWIESSGGRLFVEVDGEERGAPLALLPTESGRTVRLRAYEQQDLGPLLWRFERWSDGESRAERDLAIPPEGGSIGPLGTTWASLATWAGVGGKVLSDPPSDDSYYQVGGAVRVQAIPDPGWAFVGWRGDSGDGEPVLDVVMDRPTYLEAEFRAGTLLPWGVRRAVDWPAQGYYGVSVYEWTDGFVVRAPHDARSVEVAFEAATAGAEVDLYVNRFSAAVDRQWSADGSTWIPIADHHSATPGGSERVVIDAASDPPLEPGAVYGIVPVSHTPEMRVRGSLLATVETAPLAGRFRAEPRAFTFAAPANSDAASQAFALANEGGADAQFRIESDRPWLSIAPLQGWLAPGESLEVSVRVARGGLASDAHAGSVRIAGEGANELVLPVHFVALPAIH